MAAPLATSASDCCVECPDTPITNVPGPAGADGAAGAAGTNGTNAFTTTTAGYTQPAVAATVSVAVVTSAWAVIGQVVYIQNGGYYTVTAIADSTHITVSNLGYTGNAAPAAVIGSGQKVGPGGLKGVDGVAVGVTLNSISPTIQRGDSLWDNGSNAPAASLVRLAVGTDGTRPMADSGQPTGILYAKVDLADTTEITGIAAVANGGTGSATAAGAATNLAVLPLAGGTMTGNLVQSYAAPVFRQIRSGGGVDEKRWEIAAGAARWELSAVNDAGAVFNLAISVNRTGATPTRIDAYYEFHMAGAAKVDTFIDLQQELNVALVNGNNNNVVIGTHSFIKIKAGPSAAFAITGIAGGVDGRVLILYNATGQNMTIGNENVLSTASNRILTTTGADFVSTADCVVKLIYDLDAQRWIVVSTQG